MAHTTSTTTNTNDTAASKQTFRIGDREVSVRFEVLDDATTAEEQQNLCLVSVAAWLQFAGGAEVGVLDFQADVVYGEWTLGPYHADGELDTVLAALDLEAAHPKTPAALEPLQAAAQAIWDAYVADRA